ncbi:MAG: redox-sensing transcriptional repressor Rex [Acidobacteriota bacterium]|jgi:redox-sensing transcriptional repressor|nr:redox-sensing transcriptional repressor Rex [Acidobacteriota bacterium]
MNKVTDAIPVPALRRLPSYLRLLRTLQGLGREVVSCTHIAEELGLQPTQVRKDLQATGIAGRPKVGYPVQALIDAIEDTLGWRNATEAFLVGAGNLGSALLGYRGFAESGLEIVAAFDVDPAKVGTEIHGKAVLHLDKFADLVRRMHVHIGIITTPGEQAQEVADLMVRSGIKAIWNFAPADITVPDPVILENVSLSASLAVLSNRLETVLRSAEHAGGLDDERD